MLADPKLDAAMRLALTDNNARVRAEGRRVLAKLYPGGKDEYLKKFTASLDQSINAGHILADSEPVLAVCGVRQKTVLDQLLPSSPSLRELLVVVLRMRPKIALLMSVVGAPKLTELVRLVASARNSSLTRSVTGTRFNSDASISK